MRIWAKIIKIDTRVDRDLIYETDLPLTLPNLEEILREICYKLDISTPILLRANFNHFKQFNTLKFYPADFIDHEDFRYFEIESVAERKKERNTTLYSSQSSFD